MAIAFVSICITGDFLQEVLVVEEAAVVIVVVVVASVVVADLGTEVVAVGVVVVTVVDLVVTVEAVVEVAAEEVDLAAVAVDAGAEDVDFVKRGGKAMLEPHRHEGIYIARGKEDVLVTRNMVPGESVYGEKRMEIEDRESGNKVEYRVWNPFRSKLAASVVGGVDSIHMPKGSKVLYLGAANGTTVSHVSDIVGEEGAVYAVEFSARSGRDLVNMAKKRPNIIPIVEDARHPLKYRMMVPMVDTIFADVAQPDQARIVALNAQYFLKQGKYWLRGHFVISIKANCIDSTAPAEAVFAGEVDKLKAERLKPLEQLTLEPYERDHAVVVGVYRPPGM
ncbi:hypothetical protein HAZT_HAZT006385 [Hyalella azteca]|uniref:rRNA 2'-O-methyltransferase fibrillarin n=1 Tax=Hyalella azteca TaxID=294128 RepID=A0A6A0H6K0_HYAAZ|nr:hypothetical protein HAZT_HAZT006385 [Hyalella azteca]